MRIFRERRMILFKPKNIERWQELINYEGMNFDDYFIACWRFFRCSPLERANFKYIKARFAEHNLPAWAVIYPSFTDDVMSVRYYILIHKDCEKALRLADLWAKRSKDGSALDPVAAEDMDRRGMEKHWTLSSVAARVRYCQDCGITIFAARRKALPYGKDGIEELIEQLSEAA